MIKKALLVILLVLALVGVAYSADQTIVRWGNRFITITHAVSDGFPEGLAFKDGDSYLIDGTTYMTDNL
jgi:hypothetical protein